MAYKSKFLHFKTKASYEAERAKTTAGTEERKVFDAYISFIDEGPMICTWGKEYKCDISASEVEALVNAGKISPATVAPLIAGTAAVGTSTKYAREDHRHPEQVNITGNAATATTATNLASAPSFINNGNTIKITVGNKTSTEFTIPYASKTSAAETLMYGRDIILDGDVTGSTIESFNGSKNVTINTTISTINAEKLTGIINVDRLPEIPIEKLPAGALERMFVVESQTAAIDAVKAGTIQEGDVVQIGNGGLMYFCIDDAATTFRNAFKEFTAGAATSVPWSGVTGAPTKLSQFNNDAGYLTSVPAQTWESITGKPTFATVATSGSYNDLTDTPTIPSAYTLPTASTTVLGGVKIGSGINISSGVISATYSSVGAAAASHTHAASQVTGLATVATSGSYDDLTDKPSIPSLSGYATQSWVTSQGYLTSIPAATRSTVGGIKLGASSSQYLAGDGKFYIVQFSELSGAPDMSLYVTGSGTTGYLAKFASGTSINSSGIALGTDTTKFLRNDGKWVVPASSFRMSISGNGTIDTSVNELELLFTGGLYVGDITDNKYSISIYQTSTSQFGAVKIGNNISVSSGTISLSKSNVTSALGYTPSSPLIQTGTITNNTITAGYAYDVSSAVVNMVSGFSESNPDAVVATASKITSFPSECSVMDGIMDLNGSVYVYCFTYIGGIVYINGAVYA